MTTDISLTRVTKNVATDFSLAFFLVLFGNVTTDASLTWLFIVAKDQNVATALSLT